MDRLLPGLPLGAGIAFLRLRSLGDTLLLTPAAAALKSWRPDLRLAILVEPAFAAAVAHNSDFERIIEVPRHLTGRLAALKALREFRPAVALGLHGGTTAAWLARASGAPHRATFEGLRHPWAYNHFAPPAPPPPGRACVHTVEHVVWLLTTLGMPPTAPGPLKLVLRPEARSRIRQHLARRGVTGPFAFLSTEARERGMRWPVENFAALAAWLRRDRGLASVQASAGPGEPVPGATLFSGTTVEELMALEAEASLVIANDGGPVHIAAALGKPLVAIYSTTDVPVWFPWQTPARCLQRIPLSSLPVGEVIGVAAAVAGPVAAG